MTEVVLYPKTRICRLNGLLRWLPNTLNGSITGIVGEKYWNSRANASNNEQFAALARDIYAQLNNRFAEATEDIGKIAVEVFVSITVDPTNGRLVSIHSFQVNLYRIVATVGGSPTSHEELKASTIIYVGSKKDQLNTPPWKDFLKEVRPKVKMMARIKAYYTEQGGIPPDIRDRTRSKTLPVLIIGDEILDASTSVKNKVAYPCLTVDDKKKTFFKSEELKDFILTRIEPNVTFVRSRSGQTLVDKEVKKVAQVFKDEEEERRIDSPSSLKSVLLAIKKADAVLKKSQPSVGKKADVAEKASKNLLEIKATLKELRVGLRTVNGELLNLEKKFKGNAIPYPTYSSDNTRFLTRKNELETELSGLLEEVNEKVMKPLKAKM